MSVTQDVTQNDLLAAMTLDARKRIAPHLKLVNQPIGTVIYESGQSEDYLYFPTTSIISLLYVMTDGSSAEIAVIGHEGIAGVAAFLGGHSTTSRAVVQSSGHSYRLPAKVMQTEFSNCPDTRDLLLRFTQTLITQMAQTVACNRHHSIEQQLCRWILLSLDRLQGNQLRMTQELIANMLGVRRESVTDVACKLHKKGIMDYKRGLITVIDRPAMEKLCCECYQAVKLEADRLMHYTAARQAETRKRTAAAAKSPAHSEKLPLHAALTR